MMSIRSGRSALLCRCAALASAVVLLSPSTGLAQASGSTCSSAQVISGDGSVLASMIHTGVSPVCQPDATEGVWFEYQAVGTGTLHLMLGAIFANTGLEVFDGCVGASLGCGDGSVGDAALSVPVVAGQSYFILCGAFPLGNGSLLFDGPEALSLGDECSDAIVVGNGSVLGTLADKTGSTGDDDTCGFNNTIDAWYAYTALGDGTLTVTSCNPGSDFDTVLSAFDDCPESGGIELDCNDDVPGALDPDCVRDGFNRLSTISFGVEEKQTYYIRVSAFNDDLEVYAGVGDFELTFDGPTVSLWDECGVARIVSEGAYHGTLLGNTGSTGDDSSCAFGDGDTIDEWYAYTASDSGTVRVTTCLPGTEFDTVLSAFDACGGLELACNDDTTGALTECALGVGALNRKSTFELNVTGGETYYIRVSNFGDDVLAQGGFGTNYDLKITLLCPCDWNSDGNLNDQDFFDWVNDFFSASGPRGQSDFNNDTFQNDQDWFDFVNCFFTPPMQCGNTEY